MSRNFRPSIVGPGGSHVLWAPNLRNVLGLDAAVIVTNATGLRVNNLMLPEKDLTHMVASLNTDPDGGTYSWTRTNYTQVLEIILSGTDGSGSTVACASPRRIQAMQAFAAMQHTLTGTLNHVYRRDDNSGTTDTFKDRVQVQRFCNGAARGVLGTNIINANMNNQDLDPIRRPCDPPLPGMTPTPCTDLTTGLACLDDTTNPNCTQGLVVPISQGDVGYPDATDTIASRVAQDTESIGYAGREGVFGPGWTGLTGGPSINKMPFSDSIVRSISAPYMLSRRLFLQFADADGDPSTSVSSNTDVGFGGANRVAAEMRLYDWMTAETGVPSTSGRCHTDPLMRAHGYLSCEANCATDIGSDPDNFCNGPYDPVPATPAACIPYSASGGPAWAGAAVTCAAGSVCCSTNAACPAISVSTPGLCSNALTTACQVNTDCPTGGTCTTACPAAFGRPAEAACWNNGDCQSNNCTEAVHNLGVPTRECAGGTAAP